MAKLRYYCPKCRTELYLHQVDARVCSSCGTSFDPTKMVDLPNDCFACGGNVPSVSYPGVDLQELTTFCDDCERFELMTDAERKLSDETDELAEKYGVDF